MNLRVIFHLLTTFPERYLLARFALVTEGGHTTTVGIADLIDIAPTCQGTVDATSTGPTSRLSLVHSGATVDGREQMPGAGSSHVDCVIRITAVNLPLECQWFGHYLMWVTSARSRSPCTRGAPTVRSLGHVYR